MKKNQLYTINRFNRRGIEKSMPSHTENIFWPGGEIQTTPWDNVDSVPPQVVLTPMQQIAAAKSTPERTITVTGNGTSFGTTYNNVPTTSGGIIEVTPQGATGSDIGSGSKGIIKNPALFAQGVAGAASVVGNLAGGAIADGYSAGSGVGAVTSAIQSINTGNPIIDGIKNVGVGILGGIFNRGFGVKENKGNTAFIKANTNAAKTAGQALGQANTNDTVLDLSGSMVGSSGFKANDLFKNGWWTNKGTRKGNRLIGAENRMLAFQNHALGTGVENADKNQDSGVMSNFIGAFGGFLPNDDPWEADSNMPAVNYGFMSDYLTHKKRQAERSGNFVMKPQNTVFAFGGDMQAHGGDFGTGLSHIDAGGSHEENPYDGVQMGVDNEGTPNLVEEGEVIWNDYVFSNRIELDDEAKKKFHFPKKKDITYADAAKKLEKEIAERTNDPISKAGFNAQMKQLEEQQERQKQEMEAERAKEAFNTLSDEEKVAVMENAAQQEAARENLAAQEQAIVEQQQVQPSSEEEAMMQQQMNPEEQAAMEQQQLAQMQANVSALGGQIVKASDIEPQANKFAVGGRKAKKTAQKYNKEWFSQMAKALGISDEEMSKFTFNSADPDANLSAFNQIYRDSQYNKALETYKAGQRQSKRNELFGDKGLYRYSADKKHLYRGRVNDTDRVGYINKDYTGDLDSDGNILGFLTTEDYNKKRAAYETEKDGKKKAELLNELEGYKAINEKAGDYMYDFYGKRLETPETMSEEDILKQYDADYNKDFKWDDKDAQALQYPVGMEHSNESYLRYIPALGGAIGVVNDIFSSPDYSRAVGIQKAGQITPMIIKSNFKPIYMTYRPLDIWYGQNALNAQSRATDRALLNSSSPSRMAGLITNGYKSQLASGNLFRQAQEYNDALNKQVVTHNSGENKTAAQLDLQGQLANQKAAIEAGMYNARYNALGYQMMEDIDARRNASMNANLTNVLQSIGNIGEEAYDEDRLRWLERTGVLKSKTLGANGGKLIKKKKGLTY